MTRLKNTERLCKYASGMTFVVMAALSTGCGAGTLHEAVRSADEKVLGRALDEVELNAASAQRLAHRWMRSQMRHVVLREGLQQLDGLEPCLRYFRADLAYRAAKSDPLAPHVALRRADAGYAPALSYAHRLTDAESVWRAAAARTMVTSQPTLDNSAGVDRDHALVWRHRLLLDDAEVVRAAAARAAEQSASPADVDALLEAARLDPSQSVSEQAISALGAIATRKAITGLGDLWAGAGDETREAIVRAWSHAMLLNSERGKDAGSRERLRKVAQGQAGRLATLAALGLLEASQQVGEDEQTAIILAVALRALQNESAPVKVDVLERIDLRWPGVREAVRKAVDSHDDRVAVAALARLANHSEADRALLLVLAKKDGLAATRARTVLAMSGDARVVALLESQLKSASALDRAAATQALVALGRWKKASKVLADESAFVRATAACAILEWRPSKFADAKMATRSMGQTTPSKPASQGNGR